MADAASLVRAAIAEIRRGRIIQTDGLAEAADEIERLTEANAALMAERTSLIETKREQIERLTAERDAALAKVAQYEQAPVVGWKLMHPLLHTRFSLHPITDGDRSLGWTDTALVARPEVTK